MRGTGSIATSRVKIEREKTRLFRIRRAPPFAPSPRQLRDDCCRIICRGEAAYEPDASCVRDPLATSPSVTSRARAVTEAALRRADRSAAGRWAGVSRSRSTIRSAALSSRPVSFSRLSRLDAPDVTATAAGLRLNSLATSSTTASLARLPVGGAATRSLSASPWRPTTSVRPAPGWTWTASVTPPSIGPSSGWSDMQLLRDGHSLAASGPEPQIGGLPAAQRRRRHDSRAVRRRSRGWPWSRGTPRCRGAPHSRPLPDCL